MSTHAKLWAGFTAVAGLYLVASLVTVADGGHRFRPLYEGIGPAAPYRWVHPPAAFKSTNIAPIATSQSLQLTGAGSEQSGAATIDGQLVLNLPAGALPPVAGQHSVSISIAPVDPAKLGRLPAGLYSDGNAYLITVTYQPSGQKIPSATKPIDAVIRTPVSSVALLASTDGTAWARIPDHHIPTQAAVAATFTTFGYLVAAANVQVVTSSPSSGTTILLVVFLGLAAILLVWTSITWRRGRRAGRRPA